MKKAIIFDWSGVVKDTVDSHVWIVNKMFEKFDVHKISLEEYKENWKQPYMLFYNKYVPSMTIEEEMITFREATLDKDCPKSKDFSGITELIKKLKNKDYFLAVVTSDFKETIFPEIKEYGLENIFDDVRVELHDKFNAVDQIIKERNFNLKDVYFIGDSNHEIEVSKKIGIKSIAVTWGFSTEKVLKSNNPDYLVRNLEELEDILLK
jgi:phosphoglycolate phosphatase